MRKTKAIEVANLTKMFGSFKAVDTISFEVFPGEIFGFLGANGAGKSTAIRMLCGLLKSSAGNAKVAGFDIDTQAQFIKENIGYMSQRFSLYEDLTVSENLRLYGGIYGIPRKELPKRIEQQLKVLDLTESKDILVEKLPLGWKQKLAFIAATIHKPKIVFLDEPTGGVDPITRRQFWELIYQAASEGITVFVTTHYMDEAEYCDRVSIMVDGRIKALDTPKNLKEEYQVNSMDDVFENIAKTAKK